MIDAQKLSLPSTFALSILCHTPSISTAWDSGGGSARERLRRTGELGPTLVQSAVVLGLGSSTSCSLLSLLFINVLQLLNMLFKVSSSLTLERASSAKKSCSSSSFPSRFAWTVCSAKMAAPSASECCCRATNATTKYLQATNITTRPVWAAARQRLKATG